MAYVIIIPIIALAVWFLFAARATQDYGGNCVYLDNHQISAQELFQRIRSEIEDRKLPVKAEIKSMYENGIMSAKREYLRISYRDNGYDITSGFFGNGSYVAWHFFLKDPTPFNRIPVLNSLRGKDANMQSFARADSAASFQTIIKSILQAEIDAFAETKGIRPIAAEELAGTGRTKKKQLA